MMSRILFCLYFCLLTSFAFAASGLYQVDMILFTHSAMIEDNNTMIATEDSHAIPLRTVITTDRVPYHLQPHTLSHLNKAYWTLHHQQNYHILCHYTWLQPSNNQRSITLPAITESDWNITGTVRIRQSNYYLLDTNLNFSSKSDANKAFVLAQKQRLKPGSIYYLDHPAAGMLITVRKV